MAKRVAIATILAILAAVLIRTVVSEKPSDVPHASTTASVPHAWNTSVAPSDAPTNPPRTAHTPDTDEKDLERAEPVTTEPSRLSAIEQAALAGNASAQFRLSNAMRHCTSVLAYSEDSVQDMEDPLRRAYLLQSRDECQYFADRRERLVDDAFEWERRAIDAGDPGARAMLIAMQAGNGELQADQAQQRLETLLASNDSFVFGAVATLSMSSGVTAESAAWHMLACEGRGPPELCSIMNGAISDACTGTERCGNTGPEVDVAQYYMHAHPELFDIARGRYQALKDQLQQGRAGEVDLHLAIQPLSGG